MKRLILFITLLQIGALYIKSYAQTAVVPRQLSFHENFGATLDVGKFPLNDNSFITTESSDPSSYQTDLNSVLAFTGQFSDVKVKDIIYAQDGFETNTISGGLGPYCFIENTVDAKLMLSLSDKIYAVQFALNTITSTSSNLLISYEVELTESSTTVTGYNFLEYRTSTSSAWNEVPGTTYSSFGRSVGDVVTFSGITLPTCLVNDYVEFRWITFQDDAVTGSDVLSFSIDNIKIDPSPDLPQLSSTVLTVCGSGSLTFSLVNTVNPFQYRWYNSSMDLLSITSTNFKTPLLTSSELFFVEAYNGSCTSAMVQLSANVYTIPGTPLLDQSIQTICGAATFTFNVQSAVFSHYNWYTASVSGSFITDNSTYTTPSFSNQTDVFWVEANDGFCSGPRTKAVATSYSIPSTPVLSNSVKSICGTGTITFNLQSTPEPFYHWYDAATSGSLIGINTTYTTPTSYNQVVNVWVEALNGTCTSPLVQSTANFYRLPDTPLPISSLMTVCGTANFTFGVQNIETNYNWYDTSVGGASLITNPNYTPASFYNSTITKWVEASTGICFGARVSVTGISFRTPATPILSNGIQSICGSGTITFNLQSTPEPNYRWFNASVSGTLLGSNTTYTTPTSYDQVVNVWVRASDGTCTSSRVQAIATFYRVPTAPVLDNSIKEICDAGTITFNIQNSSEPHYFWYHTITGGALLTDNASYTTPSFYNKSDTVWVEGNSGHCTGPRSMVIGVYNRVPVLPIVDNMAKSICGTGTISFNVQNTVEPFYRWFDNASTGSLLITDPIYSTPSFYNSVQNVWVESYTGKCSSARVMVVATSYRIPELPVLDQSVKSICGTATLTFNVNNIEPLYKWYNTNGSLRSTGASASTISIYDQMDTLFVEANTDLCVSNKVMAVGISKSIPPIPIVVNPTDSLCGPGSITFLLTNTGNTLNYRWYDASTDGQLLLTVNNFETPELEASTNYWVDAFDGTCFSSRVNTFAKIKDLPDPTITINNQILTATPFAAQYQWYIGSFDKPSSQGLTNTLNIKYSGGYYVRLTNSNGCEIIGTYHFIKAGGDTIYYEGFQSGMPTNYSIINGDNAEVQNVADYYTIYGNNPWAVIPATKDVKSDFFGGINNQVASATSLFANKKINANRWMITDTIALNHEGLNYNDLINNTTFSFQWKGASDDGGDYPDSYDVLISSTSKDTSAFTVLYSVKRESIHPTLRIVDPLAKSYNGQKVFFAFKLTTPHYSGNRLMIDDLMVIATTTKISDEVTLIEEDISKNVNVAVYPNPAEEQITIDYKVSKPTPMTLYIYDLLGNVIANKNFGFVSYGDYSYEFDLKAYPNGMYFIKVVSGSESEIIKLIKR